jgi:hypothetical protein
VIHRGPSRGYDGKPLYHADVYLSTEILPHEPAGFMVKDGAPEESSLGSDRDRPALPGSIPLTWQQRAALQKASQALLQQLGVSDVGQGREGTRVVLYR